MLVGRITRSASALADEGIVQPAAKAVDTLSPRLHHWRFPAPAGREPMFFNGMAPAVGAIRYAGPSRRTKLPSQGFVMATRITLKGRVTIPKEVREALQLSPGDGVEFAANDEGEMVLSKTTTPVRPAPGRGRALRPRIEAQTRRRAAELLRLLRGLD